MEVVVDSAAEKVICCWTLKKWTKVIGWLIIVCLTEMTIFPGINVISNLFILVTDWVFAGSFRRNHNDCDWSCRERQVRCSVRGTKWSRKLNDLVPFFSLAKHCDNIHCDGSRCCHSCAAADGESRGNLLGGTLATCKTEWL